MFDYIHRETLCLTVSEISVLLCQLSNAILRPAFPLTIRLGAFEVLIKTLTVN